MQNVQPWDYECVVCGREVSEIDDGTAVQGEALPRHKIRDIASVWLRPGDWCPGGGAYPNTPVTPPFLPVHPGDPIDPDWLASCFNAIGRPRGAALSHLREALDDATRSLCLAPEHYWPVTYSGGPQAFEWQLPTDP